MASPASEIPAPPLLGDASGGRAALPAQHSAAPEPTWSRPGAWALRPVAALVLLFVFLVGVQGLSSGIKSFGLGQQFLGAVSNPMVGLVAGILCTTLVQSSSVTTSLVVGLVGGGTLTVGAAVPIIMGANIGTTVTNTLASMAQVGRPYEFRRALAAATCHDFFNYFAVILLLPLEWAFGFLEKLSAALARVLPATTEAVQYKSPLKLALKAATGALSSGLSAFTSDTRWAAAGLILLSILIIFGALAATVRVMKPLATGRLSKMVTRALGRNARGQATAIGSGLLFTFAVQSSSITTSIMVPLAGVRLLRLRQVFPVTVGANIGTTITALIASLAITGAHAAAARQIALIHLLFNVIATLVLYVPRPTRRWSMAAAMALAKLAVRRKRWAIAYVLGAFVGLPLAILSVTA